MRRLLISVLVILQVILFNIILVSCDIENEVYSPVTDDSNAIRLGILEPFDGRDAQYAEGEFRGFLLAYELRKEALGRPVELVVGNLESDVKTAAVVCNNLIKNHKVSALLGGYSSSFSFPIANVAKKLKVPFVTPCSTQPKLTRNNPYTFRCCYTDDYQGQQLAYYLAEMGVKTVAITFDHNDYSIGNAAYFRQTFKTIYNKDAILYFQPFKNPPSADIDKDRFFIDDCQQIKVLSPDAILLPADPIDAANFIEQAKSEYIGMEDVLFVCTDSCYQQDFLRYGGDNVEGVLLATPFFSGSITGDASISFVEAYRKRYGEEPRSDAALAFDAYNLVIDAIERAESDDPQKIRDALQRTREYEGTTGEITMDENGDPLKPIFVIAVQGGVFTAINVIEPDLSQDNSIMH